MIKENINKIDHDLKQLFELVEISEKANKSDYYFEVKATSTFNFGGDNKVASIKVNISKPELNESNIRWRYFVNTNDDNSDVIERVSNINSIAKDVYETLSKKRMSIDYLESLESANESKSSDGYEFTYKDGKLTVSSHGEITKILDVDKSDVEKTKIDIIKNKKYYSPGKYRVKSVEESLGEILERFEINQELVSESKYEDNVEVRNWVYSKSLKPQDKYMLSLNLTTAGFRVDFEGDNIKIQYV